MMDVAVVGGGPAGSSAALKAAEKGAKTVILEEHPEIGIPPHCAGIVCAEDLLKTGFTPPSKVIQAEVDKVLAWYEEYSFELPLKKKFLILNRPLFDKHLAKLAEQRGAELLLGSKVVGVRRDGSNLRVKILEHDTTRELLCKVVVAADGVASRIARMLGLHVSHELAACIQYEVTPNPIVEDGLLEVYLGTRYAPGGYAWVVPAGESARIGLGVRRAKKPAKHYLDKLLHQRAPEAKIIRVMAHPVPVGGPLLKTYTENLLVVGDAAGHVVPSSGAGIVSALICGKYAGEVAAEAALKDLHHSQCELSRYEALWRSHLGGKFEAALKIRRIAEDMPKEDRELIAQLLRGTLGEHIKHGRKVRALLYLLLRHPRILKYAKAVIQAGRYGLF